MAYRVREDDVPTRDRTLYCGDVYSTLGGAATSARWTCALPALILVYLAPSNGA